jgi:hypothetical protein
VSTPTGIHPLLPLGADEIREWLNRNACAAMSPTHKNARLSGPLIQHDRTALTASTTFTFPRVATRRFAYFQRREHLAFAQLSAYLQSDDEGFESP